MESKDQEVPDFAIVVRTVTVFIPHSTTTSESLFQKGVQRAVQIAKKIRSVLNSNNITVQTIRISSSSPTAFGCAQNALLAAKILDESGVDYANIGNILPSDGNEFVNSTFITNVVQSTSIVSLSISLIDENTHRISLNAVREAASAVQSISRLDSAGFSNLRFAASANVKANGPFFPCSYSSKETNEQNSSSYVEETLSSGPTAAIGLQGASLLQYVVQKNTDEREDGSYYVKDEVYEDLKNCIEFVTNRLAHICEEICNDIKFDFSTAPIPHIDHSVGDAVMKCAGTNTFPSIGGISIATKIASAIDLANFPRTGFCGIMLPVSEDIILARDVPTINDLLIFSTICGTGLDVSEANFIDTTSVLHYDFYFILILISNSATEK